jgi:hypothetical protein
MLRKYARNFPVRRSLRGRATVYRSTPLKQRQRHRQKPFCIQQYGETLVEGRNGKNE